MSGPVRWGLLGAGWIAARAIAPAIHSADGATLQAVGARDADRARRLGPATAYDSYQAVVEASDVDAVFIALANDQHLPWALAALEAGKTVLCEKPLALNATEVKALREAEARTSARVIEATWNLWHPRSRRARALVRSGALGHVTSVEAAFTFEGVPDGNYRLDPLRGGGALLDVGCYALAATAWVAGGLDRAATVESVQRTFSPSHVDLTTVAQLRLEADGRAAIQARVHASFDEPAMQSLIVRGTTGELTFGHEAYTSYLAPSTLTWTSHVTDEARTEHFAPVDPYRVMIEQVSRVCTASDAFLPDPDLAHWVASTMDAIAAASA